ncbi:hypothetical protein pmac_cds_53 [Pandoravirus macleodensis]|uniref:Ankyrin repeat domain containing protein n=1 Tax=Pandoravirus macleodensis TaxID=2107707 RepID=A0A2U7UE45_9VIRU|nr:hypothetical protein pmac_cds_53 [Pandoravirus macleodensis]AVK76741.1 hypothetical protein pmac_cds_53 [Pandoravirus macleodensis]UMO79283.1 hypothetical protein [Pandoravirus aubagnensis]
MDLEEREPVACLAAMPAEVILGIGHFLEHPRDAAACVMASPIFPPCLVRDLAVRHFCNDPKGAIDARAPLDIVMGVLPAGAPVEALLMPAVHRGDCGIVEWLCDRIEEECADMASQDHGDGNHVCGCPNFCAYSHHHRNRCFVPESSYGIEAAMIAIDARRADLLGALLRTEAPSLNRCKRTQIVCMSRAARVGDVDIVAMLHRLAQAGRFVPKGALPPASCGCCQEVVYEAFLGCHVPLLDWLMETGCDAAPHAYDQRIFDCIPLRPSGLLLKWVFDTAPPDLRPTVNTSWMRSAAAHGSLVSVRFMHDRGLATCGLDTLRAAVCEGVDILKWAIGEAVDGSPARGTPIEAWHSVTIAWAAAMRGGADVIAWMLSRPDTASAVTPNMIACALAKGHANVALAAHASGMLPLDRWDAVEAAARSGSVDTVRTIIQHGGVYKTSALTTALTKGNADVVAYLCNLYGTADAQDAIDSMPSYNHSRAWTWLRDRVPGLCVAHALAATWATSYGDSNTWSTLCRCARCVPSVPV